MTNIPAALRAEMVSMLAKYVPGGVWTPAARVAALAKLTGETRYGAEIVAQTLDYQGAADENAGQAEQVVADAPAPQPAETVAPATEAEPAKPKRSHRKKVQAAAA